MSKARLAVLVWIFVVGRPWSFGQISGTAVIRADSAGLSVSRAIRAVDQDGFLYFAGTTTSPTFPTTPNSFQPPGQGSPRVCSVTGPARFYCDRAFVVKLDPTGTRVIFSTILSSYSRISSLALSPAGTIYVTGYAIGGDFPVTPSAWGKEADDDGAGGFIVSFNADGSRLLAASRIPGGLAGQIGVDANGDVVVAGSTKSNSRLLAATPGAYQSVVSAMPTGPDLFVLKIDPQLSILRWCAIWGGRGGDSARALHIDREGDIVLVGSTASAGAAVPMPERYPTTPNAYNDVKGEDAVFVTKLHRSGTRLIYSAMWGGSKGEGAGIPYFASDGSTYLAGITRSDDYPTTAREPGATPGRFFVSRLAADGSSLLLSRTFGPSVDVYPSLGGIDVLSDGSMLLYGSSSSPLYPITADAVDPCAISNGGGEFMTRLSADGGKILYSSFTSSLFVPNSGGVFYLYDPLASNGVFYRRTLDDPPFRGVRCVANAASGVQGDFATGMIFTVKGPSIGSFLPATGRGPNNFLAGTEIRVEGSPCSILYTSLNQINAIFPFEIYGSSRLVEMEIFQDRVLVGKVSRFLHSANPAIFTIDGSGRGPAAALNEDGTLNSENNPAKVGSIVVMYMTGNGEPIVLPRTGAIATQAGGELKAKAQIFFRNLFGAPSEAEVLYAGDAPGSVYGLVQLNVRIPPNLTSRGAVHVWYGPIGGGSFSPMSRFDPPVTIWVR